MIGARRSTAPVIRYAAHMGDAAHTGDERSRSGGGPLVAAKRSTVVEERPLAVGRCLTRAGRPLACVVANPSKLALTGGIRAALDEALVAAGYARPVWLDTSPGEPGTAQARLAIASGADLVVAVGGDGTVHAVAAGVAHTGVALGVLPLGTANLAARNLGLPVGRPGDAVALMIRAADLPTDLVWVRTDPADEPVTTPEPVGGWARPVLGDEHACMVVAGIGFDAGLVASTRPALKARIRWGAYAVAAVANLDSPRMDLVLRMRGGLVGPARVAGAAEFVGPTEPAELAGSVGSGGDKRVERLQARTVLLANGGRLPAGITLLRDARMDDGVLDVAVIDTVGGVIGWSSLARQVLPPFAATYADPAHALGRVTLRRGDEAVVRIAEPALVQVDGELLAPTRGVRARMDAGALLVRRPV